MVGGNEEIPSAEAPANVSSYANFEHARGGSVNSTDAVNTMATDVVNAVDVVKTEPAVDGSKRNNPFPPTPAEDENSPNDEDYLEDRSLSSKGREWRNEFPPPSRAEFDGEAWDGKPAFGKFTNNGFYQDDHEKGVIEKESTSGFFYQDDGKGKSTSYKGGKDDSLKGTKGTTEGTKGTDRVKREIFVGGVNPWSSEENLQNHFERFGPVEKVDIRKGFAFVLFADHDVGKDDGGDNNKSTMISAGELAVERAILGMNEFEFEGRKLDVKQSTGSKGKSITRDDWYGKGGGDDWYGKSSLVDKYGAGKAKDPYGYCYGKTDVYGKGKDPFDKYGKYSGDKKGKDGKSMQGSKSIVGGMIPSMGHQMDPQMGHQMSHQMGHQMDHQMQQQIPMPQQMQQQYQQQMQQQYQQMASNFTPEQLQQMQQNMQQMQQNMQQNLEHMQQNIQQMQQRGFAPEQIQQYKAMGYNDQQIQQFQAMHLQQMQAMSAQMQATWNVGGASSGAQLGAQLGHHSGAQSQQQGAAQTPQPLGASLGKKSDSNSELVAGGEMTELGKTEWKAPAPLLATTATAEFMGQSSGQEPLNTLPIGTLVGLPENISKSFLELDNTIGLSAEEMMNLVKGNEEKDETPLQTPKPADADSAGDSGSGDIEMKNGDPHMKDAMDIKDSPTADGVTKADSADVEMKTGQEDSKDATTTGSPKPSTKESRSTRPKYTGRFPGDIAIKIDPNVISKEEMGKLTVKDLQDIASGKRLGLLQMMTAEEHKTMLEAKWRAAPY